MSRAPRPATRWFATGRLVWGSLLLTEPQRMFRMVSGSPGTGASTVVVRALGLREVVQASVTLVAPTSPVLRTGAVVDAIHALTMLALGMASRRYRRPALLSAASATAQTVAGRMLAGTVARTDRHEHP